GISLALACDIILAAEGSKFVFSFSKVGLIADGGLSYFLSNLIGPYRLKELLFNAETLTAEKAKELGIVNHVYSLKVFDQEKKNFIRKLSNGSSTAFSFLKKLVDQAANSNLKETLENERIVQEILSDSLDHKEGVQAFKEKRVP